jgi:mRNA-degrading endonuclease RelE of RelBE toxin-antitoxin system
MYEVLLHPDAEKIYVNADKALAKKIARCLQQLEQSPRLQAPHNHLLWRLLPQLNHYQPF